VGQAVATAPWSKADPRIQAWALANRQALEVFERGAEQPDAGRLAGDRSAGLNPNTLNTLAFLEGSRRQESGDTGGAWDCYRAVLRMTNHVRSRGTVEQRFRVEVVLLGRGWLQKRLATWAADPRTTIPMLKNALDEVQKAQPTSDASSFAVKTGYLETLDLLERPLKPREIEGEWKVRLGDMPLPTDNIESIEAARRFLLREPERSRRVLKLLCANWLAHVETPEARQPAFRVVLKGVTPITLMLYEVSPRAPAGAGAISPRELASWLVSTRDAKLGILAMRRWSPDQHNYRRAHREMVIMLATEIYRRERVATPTSEEALVGTYLESLPDDGSADAPRETTPTVE
jgi:hypothetical protein